MPDRNRDFLGPSGRQLAFAFAIIALIAVLPLAAPEHHSASQPKPQQEGATQQQGTTPAIAAPREGGGGTYQQQSAANEDGEDESVGALRWLFRAAINPDNFANFLIMLFTFALTVVGVLEYLLLRRSTKESAAAVGIAQQAADAALASANVSGQSLLADQRPWLVLTNLTPSGLFRWTDEAQPVQSCGMTVTFQNIGRTPALDVWIHMFVEVLEEPFAGSILEDQMRWTRRQRHERHHAVFPTHTKTAQKNIHQSFSQARPAARYSFLFCVVAYGSAFSDERHCTGFARQIRVIDPLSGERRNPRAGDAIPPEGIVFSDSWTDLTHAD